VQNSPISVTDINLYSWQTSEGKNRQEKLSKFVIPSVHFRALTGN